MFRTSIRVPLYQVLQYQVTLRLITKEMSSNITDAGTKLEEKTLQIAFYPLISYYTRILSYRALVFAFEEMF